MVNLTDKMRIIQMHLSGKSNRGIAAELGLNRKTVDRYVSRYEAAQAVITADGAPPDEDERAALTPRRPPYEAADIRPAPPSTSTRASRSAARSTRRRTAMSARRSWSRPIRTKWYA